MDCEYAGDFDREGELTATDFMALHAAFGCMDCPVADVHGDGVIHVGDVLLYCTGI